MNCRTVNPIYGPNEREGYEPLLKESIDHFLTQYRSGSSDLSAFGCIFFRLVQTMTDPPLEIIWFYSAATFHSSKPTFQDPSMKILVAKDLFQLLVSSSSLCDGSKKVAVLAPVIYELYKLACEFSPKEMSLRTEIESLLEGVVSYISICCDNFLKGQGNGLDNSMVCFEDLIRVWMVDQVSEKCKNGDTLRLFFSLLSDEVCRDLNAGCGIGYLAGVVMIEAFLLRLCLKFGFGASREELKKDLQIWAVQTLRGFQNRVFLDMLLRMLLEPSLPVTNLLCSENEILLRKGLYDAVILVDYSILDSDRWSQPTGSPLKDLALIWLLVADSALELVRKNCDQTSAFSYINAFSESHLPNQLIKWVCEQTSLEEQVQRSNLTTPRALIKWLLMLEDQGLRVFDHNIPKIYAKAIISRSKAEYEFPLFWPLGSTSNAKINDEGDEEMCESLNDDISVTFCMTDSTVTDEGRKRKGMEEAVERRSKLVKCDCDENSAGHKFMSSSDDDALSSGSEFENPVHGLSSGSGADNLASDEDMEEMK